MSDIDDFALKLLQRAQARQQVISENLNKENLIEEKTKIDMMIQKIAETSPRKKDSDAFSGSANQILNLSSSPRRSPMKNYSSSILNENNGKESVQESKPLPVEIVTERELNKDDAEEEKSEMVECPTVLNDGFKTPDTCKENGGIKSETRQTLKRLGQLYGDTNIASPVHKHSVLEKTPETPQSESAGNKIRSSPVARRSRLHALACTINEWEDDLSHHCSPNSRFNLSVTSKGNRGRSPPKPYPSQTNGEVNMVRNVASNSLHTNANKSFTPKVNNTMGNQVGTPKIVTDVYTDECKTVMESCTTPYSKNSSISTPLCVSSKRDRGLVIERKMYLQRNDIIKCDNTTEHVWDRSILNALEAQGFISTPQKDKMVYDYSNSQSNSNTGASSPDKRVSTSSPRNGNSNRSPSPKKVSASPKKETAFASAIAAAQTNILSPTKSSDNAPKVVDSIRKKFEFGGRSPTKVVECKPILPITKQIKKCQPKATVAQRAALYETKLNQSVLGKDPTELSVAERAKLFERQAFSNVKKTSSQEPPKPLRSFASSAPIQTGLAGRSNTQNLNPLEKAKIMEIEPVEESDTSMEEEMFRSPPPPPPILQPLINITSPDRSRRLSKSPTPKRSMSPKSKYPGSRDIKRIKINEPKEGKMYPSLTDIEATETETEHYTETEDEPMYEDEDMDSETSFLSASSLGKHIEQVAKRSSPAKSPHRTPVKSPRRTHAKSPVRSPVRSPPRKNRHYRPTEDFSASLACRQIDAYIDDALEGQDYTLDTLIEAELEAHASSTPIANSSTTSDITEGSTDVVTVISDETSKSSQVKLDFDDMEEQDAENVEANSSFGSYTATRHDLSENKILIADQGEETETNSDSVLSISCLDDAPLDSGTGESDCRSSHESNPLSTSSPHGHFVDTRSEASPVQTTTPLMHTVSFYRQQQSKKYNVATPTTSYANSQKSPERQNSEKKNVSEIIKKMEEEVTTHVKSIAQVSKALNLCKATVEFSESTENVECEKVLLVATQKRTALLNEIHRLKTDGVLSKKSMFSPGKHELGPSCRGNMTLSNVEVQLKRDFVSRAMKGDTVYHFVLLSKYRHQIDASLLVSIGNGVSSSNIQGGLLHFPNPFTIGNLEPEFSVKLEIYLLQTQKEYLPHEAKYHIKKEPKTGMLTPKKLKLDAHTAKYLGRPFQQSPAGPDAIRTTNFSLCGSLSIDISTLQRSHWTLEKNMTVCPLEGSVSIKIQCSAEGGIEEKGFLTLFDDVSGYGAWHRRWCKLTPSQLAFWRYPEDETKKEPLGAISLRKCVTNRVGPVQRDVCARASTFLLVTTRSPYEDDKDTLVTSCHSEYTAVRHLISADTKEERDNWCKQFNRALANLRAWDPQARSPDDTLF